MRLCALVEAVKELALWYKKKQMKCVSRNLHLPPTLCIFTFSSMIHGAEHTLINVPPFRVNDKHFSQRQSRDELRVWVDQFKLNSSNLKFSKTENLGTDYSFISGTYTAP